MPCLCQSFLYNKDLQTIRDILGDTLFVPSADERPPRIFASPENLKHKIIVSDTPPKETLQEQVQRIILPDVFVCHVPQSLLYYHPCLHLKIFLKLLYMYFLRISNAKLHSTCPWILMYVFIFQLYFGGNAVLLCVDVPNVYFLASTSSLTNICVVICVLHPMCSTMLY